MCFFTPHPVTTTGKYRAKLVIPYVQLCHHVSSVFLYIPSSHHSGYRAKLVIPYVPLCRHSGYRFNLMFPYVLPCRHSGYRVNLMIPYVLPCRHSGYSVKSVNPYVPLCHHIGDRVSQYFLTSHSAITAGQGVSKSLRPTLSSQRDR